MYDERRRLEPLEAGEPRRRGGEVAAQLLAGAKRVRPVRRERMADVGRLGVQRSKLVELALALVSIETAGNQAAHSVRDRADDIGGSEGGRHVGRLLAKCGLRLA